MPIDRQMVINGWSLFAHPMFLQELEYLEKQVAKLKKKDPENYKKKNITKRLAAINTLVFENIPKEPGAALYKQGGTLGDEHRHWYRAKFFQQYRLFFRFHTESKIIVYAWVNDEGNKRAYDSKTDAYKVFEKMLKNGNPPDGWDELLFEAKNLKVYKP